MTRQLNFAAVLVLLSGAAMAQGGDPPSRVGRLNFLNGPVSFRPASVEEWTNATLNYPLTTGDHLWTDQGAQTEIHIGSTAVRMGSETAMSFLNLDDRMVQISLTQGELNVHIRFLGENESIEVDTPNVSVSLLRSGDYRISADGDNAVTSLNVRGGEAEVTAGGSAFPIRSGERVRLAGMDAPSQDISQVPPPDGFDRWCESREVREESSVSARYVPREMVGYEDLDQYGVWTELPPYGMVWRPRVVVAGWAPYHFGHWAWVEPWGWTWIDDAPWGFAPFHYGRWAFAAGGWFWTPGRMAVGVAVVRPVYAPALVAFVGGPRFGVAIGFGGGGGVAAWFPLGPGEVYRPAYHVSNTYIERVNITHVTNVTVIHNTNITNVTYVNQHVNGAVTVVPHDTFVSARPVAVAAVRVPAGAMAQAEVVGYTAAVPPQRASVLAGGFGGRVYAPPQRFAAREVVARTPPPAAPVPFAAKQQALEANGGRPLAPEQLNSIRASQPDRGPRVRTFGQAPQPQSPRPNVYDRPSNARPGGSENRPSMYEAPRQNDRPSFARPAPQVNQPRPANEAPPNEPRPGFARPAQPVNPPPAVNEPRPQNDRPFMRQPPPANPPPPANNEPRQNDRPFVRQQQPVQQQQPANEARPSNEQRQNDRPGRRGPAPRGEKKGEEKKGG